MPFCAVKWCGKRSQTSNIEKDGVTFHRFPISAIIKEKWINATKRGDNWFPSKNSVICSRHFTEDSFRPVVTRRILFPNAVPTLMLPCMGQPEIYVVAPLVTAPIVTTPVVSASFVSDPLASGPLVSTPLIPLIKVEKLTPTDAGQNNFTISSTCGEQKTNQQITHINMLNMPSTCRERQLHKTVIDLSERLKRKNVIIKRLRDCNRSLKRRVHSLKVSSEEQKSKKKKNCIETETKVKQEVIYLKE